jgi:hypothetical protein
MKPKMPISDNVKREIEVRAYLIWEREGRPHGRQHEHWQLAEAEILGTAPAAKVEKKAAPAKSNGRTAAGGGAKAVVAAKAKKPAKPTAPKTGPHHG